jgi:hypothetical protein
VFFRYSLLSLFLIFIPVSSLCQSLGKSTLSGLDSVSVIVDGPKGKGGLTQKHLKTRIELRLRKAGIGVREFSPQGAASKIYPAVYVRVGASEAKGGYVYAATLEVLQVVTLSTGENSLAATYKIPGAVGWTSRDELASNVDEAVIGRVEVFANEWLEVHN